MASSRSGQVSDHVDAPPQAVWKLLADVERMGEWSPECYRVRRLNGAAAPAREGSLFKGWNKAGPGGLLRWSFKCQVTVADPASELAWATLRGNRQITLWRYQLAPAKGGTHVTESFQALHWPLDVRFFEDVAMRDRDRKRERAMRTTLQRIKEAVERGEGGRESGHAQSRSSSARSASRG